MYFFLPFTYLGDRNSNFFGLNTYSSRRNTQIEKENKWISERNWPVRSRLFSEKEHVTHTEAPRRATSLAFFQMCGQHSSGAGAVRYARFDF